MTHIIDSTNLQILNYYFQYHHKVQFQSEVFLGSDFLYKD